MSAPLPCRETDPELWFSTDPGALADAKRLCQTCPLVIECLQAADAHEDVYGGRWGVWGGLSAVERANRRRRLHEQRSRSRVA